VGPLSPQHGVSSGCRWRVAANILNKQSWTANKGWSSSLGVGHGTIKSVAGELEKCKLDLVGVQEVRWEGEGYQTTIIHFSMEKGMLISP
jgi:hypothetical protein